MIRLLWCLTALLIAANPVFAKSTIEGKVMQVKDGDTVVVSPTEGGQFFTCRLYGIDSPESYGNEKQAYGNEAEKELKELILGQSVVVTTTGDKTYNREVCMIQKDGTDINLEMVKRGYAWPTENTRRNHILQSI